jgi:hypothetical protein
MWGPGEGRACPAAGKITTHRTSTTTSANRRERHRTTCATRTPIPSVRDEFLLPQAKRQPVYTQVRAARTLLSADLDADPVCSSNLSPQRCGHQCNPRLGRKTFLLLLASCFITIVWNCLPGAACSARRPPVSAPFPNRPFAVTSVPFAGLKFFRIIPSGHESRCRTGDLVGSGNGIQNFLGENENRKFLADRSGHAGDDIGGIPGICAGA